MRISFAEATLASLDSLEGVEATCLFVFEDERPLRSAAGHVDWRLCGSLSRILLEGRFVGAQGDALLFPVPGRLAAGERLFCYGAGRRGGFGKSGFEALCRKACQALSLAGTRSFAVELPQVEGMDEVARAKAFLAEGAPHFKGERIVLLGDSRALAKAFQQAGGDMKGLTIDKDPLGAVVAVAPAHSAPHGPAHSSPGRVARS